MLQVHFVGLQPLWETMILEGPEELLESQLAEMVEMVEMVVMLQQEHRW